MKKNKKYVVIDSEGIPCPRCSRPTQAREHTHISDKLLRQPFYFTRWFMCTYIDCITTTHMVEEYKVYNNNKAARQFKDVQEDQENQARIFGIS